MIRYRPTDPSTTAVTLGGREYKVKDGTLDVPEHHAEAHEAAALIGLETVKPQQPGPHRPGRAA